MFVPNTDVACIYKGCTVWYVVHLSTKACTVSPQWDCT